MTGPTDAELLQRYLKDGADDAFRALVDRHLAMVYGVALRHLRDQALAQEVAQTVFITLARRAVWLTGHSSLGGWLYRTALNLARHHSRTETRRRQREATDKSFGELLDHFRRLEIQRMEAVAPPPGWNVGVQPQPGAASIGQPFDAALTYRIPDLSADIGAAQKSFLDQLQQNLGAARADIVGSAADSFLRHNLDDLGAGERIVGFVWQPESDGSHSLWYANADARNGEGAFQRVGEDLDPNSQTAYYAKLFGVKLPGH